MSPLEKVRIIWGVVGPGVRDEMGRGSVVMVLVVFFRVVWIWDARSSAPWV